MTENKKNEVAKTDDLELIPLDQANGVPDDAFGPGVNAMEGEVPRLPRIAILKDGALFSFPDGETTKELTGFIIHTHRQNGFWADAYQGGESLPPTCASQDAVRPDERQPGENGYEVQAKLCSSCPQAQWGTGSGGNGMACKHMRRLYLLLDGHKLPHVITLSPANLKHYSDYAALLGDKGMLQMYPGVRVKLHCMSDKTKNGQPYARVTYTPLGLAPEATIKELAKVRKMLLTTLLPNEVLGTDDDLPENPDWSE